MVPKARSRDVIVEELDGEILVYDLKRDRAHRLNPVAAAVWRRCDGKTTIPEVAASLEGPKERAEQIVLLALQQLGQAKLLEGPAPVERARISRREMARRIGLAALALPIITSITAPLAAQAASCAQRNVVCGTQQAGNCTVTATCCPGQGTCRVAGGGGSNCTCH